MRSGKHSGNIGAQLLTALLFAVLGLAAWCAFVLVAEPTERVPRVPFNPKYDEKKFADVLDEQGFEARMREIAAAGVATNEPGVGRLSGSPGFYRTEKLILDAFRAAGLEILTQELPVVVPVTEYCEILDEQGRPLEGVRILPPAPAAFLPLALPPEGVSGKLVEPEFANPTHLRGQPAEQCIVLATLGAGGQGGFDLAGLASVGVRGLLVKEESEDIERMMKASPDGPADWGGFQVEHTATWSQQALAFPRFLVRGPIERYAGRTITLRCKVAWRTRYVRNLIGVLRGQRSRQEALVITCPYDSASVIPDLAPGAEQSISLAAMLEYVRAMAPYRDGLERDVIFVATAGRCQSRTGVGVERFLQAIEKVTPLRRDYRTFEERRKDEQRELDLAVRSLAFLEGCGAGAGTAGTNAAAAVRARWDAEPQDLRKWLAERLKTVAGETSLDRKEDVLQAKLAHLRAGSPAFRDGFDAAKATDEERKDPANTHPLLTAYLAVKTLENRSANMIALPFPQLVGRKEYAEWGYAERLPAYLERIAAYHRQQIREFDDLIAVRDLFGRYARTLTLVIELYSGGHLKRSDLCVQLGDKLAGGVVEPQVSDLANAILEKVPVSGRKPAFNVVNWGTLDAGGKPETPNRVTELNSPAWRGCGFLAFTVANREYVPQGTKMTTPEDTLENLQQTEVLKQHIPALGKALLSVAHGRVPFRAIGAQRASGASLLHGTVYANAGVSEVVPSHRMGVRTFATTGCSIGGGGRGWDAAVFEANPYGEFRSDLFFPAQAFISMNFARYAEDGRILYIKDDSQALQAVFKNKGVNVNDIKLEAGSDPKPLNCALFRCAPVTLFAQSNPTTMQLFKGTEFLESQGLSAPQRMYPVNIATYTTFLPPETVFYVKFMDGSAGNPELQDCRAFMLNTDPSAPVTAEEPDIAGAGYLAADTPLIVHPFIDAAASMLRTGQKRLDLQRRYSMADKQMLDFHARGQEWLEDARARRASGDPAGALSSAGTGVAYAMNNHPVIRQRISHAVIGILWYLGLLVPFVFFCEKLIFGFPDIRKQLAAVGGIFLVVFALLRIFHPAFQMVRSSLMILLGFIMLLLTVLVTLMVTGKFKQIVKVLRSREGRVEGADINRGGVAGTAFMLGLNNMRRRKVRTALTCATLVLITFVMICFTSVSTDLVSVEYSTGRSTWNGITIRNENFRKMDYAEVASFRRLYEGRYPVTSHQWLMPSMGIWDQRSAADIKNMRLAVDHEVQVAGTKTVKRANVSSGIVMEWNEPMFSGIDKLLLTKRGWFERPPQTRAEKTEAVRSGFKRRKEAILPDTVARDLGITAEDVDARDIKITFGTDEYVVRGIIDSVEWNKRLAFDGRSMLPPDINSVQALGEYRTVDGKQNAMIPEDAARLPAASVLILNDPPAGLVDQNLSARGDSGGGPVPISCSVAFPSSPWRLSPNEPERPAIGYREQRRVVMEFLERTGKRAFYALDGVSYFGSRTRTRTLGGMLELIVPIIIAALAVFNTMRGSVYERRSEIYVYNAVGIAPNHVFFMFMAEAAVYAVMGAMLGYLLSQATGRALTMAGLTGGLNMDYSSLETIYASLAIMGAVLLSTLLPARDAARMAAPSEITSWAAPRAEGDVMTLNLPFTFTAHDRIAVMSYFHRWLDANGAGSAGPFFCSPPEPQLRPDDDQPDGDKLVPSVSSLVWLKPYDLGVSHRMDISLPTDPETGEYIAHIRLLRQSGHADAWHRTVKPFLGVLRKQFLNWRATSDAERAEMFREARAMLQKAMESGGAEREESKIED